jgi:cytochrome c
MKKTMIMVSVLSVLSTTAPADTLKLAQEKECFSCHALDRDMSKAPSFQSIARKYPDKYQPALVHKVLVGGVGHWGSAPMPDQGARAKVNEEEASRLVEWILSL